MMYIHGNNETDKTINVSKINQSINQSIKVFYSGLSNLNPVSYTHLTLPTTPYV